MDLRIEPPHNSSSIIPFPRLKTAKVEVRFDGPLSGKMWQRVSNLKSSYPDTFDYGVYDRLYDRFGEKQPRGGVLFKTPFKLVNHHSSCSKCHYAFELDTYGRGCTHNCTYCYAKDQLDHYGYWNRPMPFPVDISEIREIFATVFESDKKHKWRSVLEMRIPLRIGSMSDSFMWADQKYKVTHEMLKILKYYQYPYVVFTRSDLVGHDDYVSVMDPKISSVQFSISGGNEKLTRSIEPGAPSPSKRLSALRNLNEAGIWTAVRINPLFPIYPDGYFTNSESVIRKFGSIENVPVFPLFDFDFVDQLKQAGVQSLVVGFVRLSRIALKRVSRETNIDLTQFFNSEDTRGLAANQYSDSEIAFYYKKIQSLAVKSGIRFTTCYIGNGLKDYYQYQGLWSNKADCCDIRGNVPKFNSSSQEIPWEERSKHTQHKEMVAETHKMEREFVPPVPLKTELKVIRASELMV